MAVTKGAALKGGPNQPIRLVAGEVRRETYWLTGGIDVNGLVQDAAGRPVADCELRLVAGGSRGGSADASHPQRVTSSATGRFQFRSVGAGDWSITPAPESGYLPSPTRVRVDGGVASLDVVVAVRPGLFVDGRIVGPRGEPVAGAFVFSDRDPTAESDAGGAFRIGPFEPGDVALRVIPFGPYVAPAELHAQAGTREVVVQLSEGGRLSGRIVDASTTEPAAGLVVLIGAEATSQWATVGPDGAFAFEGLAPGVYALDARAGERAGRLVGVQVVAGEEPDGLVVELAPGGRLSLRFPPSAQRRNYRVRSEGQVVLFDAVASNETRTEPLAVGPVTVELVAADGAVLASRSGDVVAGEARLVDFTE